MVHKGLGPIVARSKKLTGPMWDKAVPLTPLMYALEGTRSFATPSLPALATTSTPCTPAVHLPASPCHTLSPNFACLYLSQAPHASTSQHLHHLHASGPMPSSPAHVGNPAYYSGASSSILLRRISPPVARASGRRPDVL